MGPRQATATADSTAGLEVRNQPLRAIQWDLRRSGPSAAPGRTLRLEVDSGDSPAELDEQEAFALTTAPGGPPIAGDVKGVMIPATILLAAADETATSFLGNVVELRLLQRDVMAEVAADPSLIPQRLEGATPSNRPSA